ncbi:hypothetical protein GW17_00049314 [Ensete ventricosum]|nr:hypothetical protein GW17_00049314 [Ensete ventricosum]RZR91775.1 hypothetical protein BHM03_00019966 [Ensete ventricosum]
MLCTSDADGGISSLRTEVWVFVPLTWSTVPDFYYSNHTHKLVAHDLFRDDVLLRLPVPVKGGGKDLKPEAHLGAASGPRHL